MDFSEALKALKDGEAVRRSGWNGKGMWIYYYSVGMRDDLTHDFIAMKTADNNKVPWLCSQTDMLAEDWEIA